MLGKYILVSLIWTLLVSGPSKLQARKILGGSFVSGCCPFEALSCKRRWPVQVRFGALKYADDPEVLFYLDELSTKLEVISVLQNDQPMGGNTYTAEALAFSDHMFTEARGSRLHKGVPQVLIVITDGESHDAEKLNATAKALRDKGILVLAVGIAGANTWELLAMAGSSDKYYFVETFGGLKGIFSDVSASVCNSSKVGKACPLSFS